MYFTLQYLNLKLVVIYLILLGIAFIYSLLHHYLLKRSKKSQSLLDTAFIQSSHLPFFALLILYTLKLSIPYIPTWFLYENDLGIDSFNLIFPIGFIVISLWFFNGLLSNIQKQILVIEKNEVMPNAAAWISACKLGRVFSASTFLMVLMYQLQIPMAQFLAPTAVGALALSFASKDVLSNVFGGLVVLCDRPFSVGDYVTIANNPEGTVRYIGWRVTEVRLENGRILYVPNGIITNSVVTNYSEKTHWFVQKEFGITYENFESIPDIAKEIEAWIKSHEYTNKRQESFASIFSLDKFCVTVRVRVYLRSNLNDRQWYSFVQSLLLEINTIVKKHQVEFSFPTRTLKMVDKK
jgi:MscS family membrane protein